jgi:periplasmic divalent cation tolerance protein
MPAVAIFVTTSSAGESKRIIDGVLKDRLAACVNEVPGVRSRYWWKGKIESGRERLLIIKTSRAKAPALVRRVKALHSYSVPEVIVLPIVAGNPAYLRWIQDSLR